MPQTKAGMRSSYPFHDPTGNEVGATLSEDPTESGVHNHGGDVSSLLYTTPTLAGVGQRPPGRGG